jgi:hypothetical protein
MSSEEDLCLNNLDNWIKAQKDMVYERNFRGPNDQSTVLQIYKDELKSFCSTIKKALWSNDITLLKNLGLTDKLIECSQNANMRLEMCDRINQWLVTYPNVKNTRHLDILLSEE